CSLGVPSGGPHGVRGPPEVDARLMQCTTTDQGKALAEPRLATAQTRHIALDVRVDGDEISGVAGDGTGRPRAFRGGVGPIGAAREPDHRRVLLGGHMELSFDQRISALAQDGTELQAAVVNENEVRAAAGLTLVIGAVAFAYAYFGKNYTPLQVVTIVFFSEFLARLTIGLRLSPMGVIAHALTRSQPPDWVSAKPKRFAWTMALALSFAMVIITNSGIRGTLPRTICLICLTLMWLESVLGLCLGCKIHGLLVRRGWTADDPAFELCAEGLCKLRAEA